MISWEQFKTIFENIGGIPNNTDKYGFYRQFMLNCLGKNIIFEWYTNLCSAYIDDIQIFGFDNIEITGTFPNKYKMNIELKKNGNVICIIPIQKY
jgi:hypothetical protein